MVCVCVVNCLIWGLSHLQRYIVCLHWILLNCEILINGCSRDVIILFKFIYFHSLSITLFVFPCLSLPLSLFILLAAQQTREPRGKSCSQGNSNSPQSWYQNSLKCELSDSSQWVQSRAKRFQILLPAECKQSWGWERASEPVVFLSHSRAGLDYGFQNFFFFFFYKQKVVCCFPEKVKGVQVATLNGEIFR